MYKIALIFLKVKVMQSYPSDISGEQFDRIRPMLELQEKKRVLGLWIFTIFFVEFFMF